MGRRRSRKWNSCLLWFVTSVGALYFSISNTLSCVHGVVATETDWQDDSFRTEPTPPRPCKGPSQAQPHTASKTTQEKFFMIVSTLDGKVSALDVKNNGRLLWSVDADSRPLLSSSITKLEITRDGMRTRLIPSLDGGLYQYDGESIEAIPMTAETLLSATYKLSDNTMMIGGKDVLSYGLDPVSGQILYTCSAGGCQHYGETPVDDETDILVISRSTQTVRAVDSRTGHEKWNFSVGHHELRFLEGTQKVIFGQSTVTDYDDEDVTIVSCPVSGDEEAGDPESLENSLKILVPEGMVVSLSPEDSQTVDWQHQFSSPVSNAWLLRSGILKTVSVFNNRHVPALSGLPQEETELPPPAPLLYVGMHQNQLYVQPSLEMQQQVAEAASFHHGDSGCLAGVPHVAWRPYLITGPSRTPIFRDNRFPGFQLIGQANVEDDDTALTVWHENYPFDNGYYLFPEYYPNLSPDNLSSEEPVTDNSATVLNTVIPASLWTWWKEVLAICIITSVVAHMMLIRYMHGDPAVPKAFQDSNSDKEKSDPSCSPEKQSSDLPEVPQPQEYASRYYSDFDHIQCLGRGGFGVVFEARNQVDECEYAIKRISIPNSDGAKEKVMREVKVLAKLDHVGIVRFFHAWLESPPPGWQEEKDKKLEDCECIGTPSHLGSVTTIITDKASETQQKDAVLCPFGGSPNSTGLGLSQDRVAGGSEEFSVAEEGESNESGSFSLGIGGVPDTQDDSLDIEFKLSDSDSERSSSIHQKHIPFTSYSADFDSKQSKKDYTNNSLDIVFEDSGCADKSNNESSPETDRAVIQECGGSPTVSQNSRGLSSEQEPSTISKPKLKKLDFKSKIMTPKLYLYIQMQLCKRETLKDWLNENTLNRDRKVVLDIFHQIVSAVDYVHDSGLMHRDLKPSNIFFSVGGTVKVGDFGLVTPLAEDLLAGNHNNNDSPYDKHTAQVGTQLYMSPEQVSGKHYGHKVDIFSLGMILFELFYPFSTQMERIRTLVDVKKQKFPERFAREMPKEEKFVQWLLCPNPADRPSAREILESELLSEIEQKRPQDRYRTRTISSSSSGSF